MARESAIASSRAWPFRPRFPVQRRSFAHALAKERLCTGKHELVLMLGVAEGTSEIRVERFGRNVDDARIADVDGAEPHGAIADGPDVLPVSIDVNAVLHALLRAEIPAVVSESAGSYVCNHVLYATLAAVEVPRIGFLHVPPLEFEMLSLAVEIAISVA
jgi:pyroglutamyl-peptidase